MKSPRTTILALLLCATVWLPARTTLAETIKRTFKESDDLVINADCGWVAYNYEDSYASRKQVAGDEEPFALASVMYTRHPVSAWQNEEGSFEETAPLKLMEDWMRNGRNVAFRIYANTVNDLPADLRKSTDVIDPLETKIDVDRIAYWDKDYVEHHRRLIQFLGKRLGDSPRLAYVDIGGVGDTGGEWFFATRQAYDRTGLTDEMFFDMLNSFIEMYREAFPRTRLFISYDAVVQARSKRAEAIALIIENDIGVRDDGLGGWPWPREHVSPRAWPIPEFWAEVPVLFEGSGRGGGVYGWKQQRKDPARILRWAVRKGHPSYINLGGAETASEKACDEMASLLMKYGRKLGYRFVLLEAACPDKLAPGASATIRTRWANRGMSPCYADRDIRIALCDKDGASTLTFRVTPDPPTGTWAPESEHEVDLTFELPDTVQHGTYSLRIGILVGHPREPDELVRTATAGAESNGYITIGDISVEP